MSHYLIVYSRSQGKLLHFTEYASERSGDLSLADRFAYEAEHGIDPDVEVVVLGASSVDALKRTHGRYFPASVTAEPKQAEENR
jgi:hypothetical protein